MREKELARWLQRYEGRPLRLMEVCGTHTAELYRSGIRQMLPETITLLSGPGCPVCVTPTAYIDKLVEYALTDGCKVLSFGDLLAVPGSRLSLAGARDQGGKVDFLYSPEDALDVAAREPDTMFVLAAVGFETTAPVWASLARRVCEEGIGNIRFLTALKTMPAAIRTLAETGHIDGFLCPGHVAVITGSAAYRELAASCHATMVIGGFTPPLLLRALARLVLECAKGEKGLWNEYPAVVRENGNERARSLMAEVFEPGDAVWRGLGNLPGSGLYLAGRYRELDAGSQGLTEDAKPASCCCDKVLTGKMRPAQCPCFGRACVPEHPVGACMVSGEGACCIAYREGDFI